MYWRTTELKCAARKMLGFFAGILINLAFLDYTIIAASGRQDLETELVG